MNSNYSFKKKSWLFIFLILIGCVLAYLVYGDEHKFKVSPHLNGILLPKYAFLEVGPEFEKSNFIIRPLIRISFADPEYSIAHIDKNTAFWTSILETELKIFQAKQTGPIRFFNFCFRMEWGIERFTFFPGKDIENKKRVLKNSFAFELKGIWYRTEGKSFASQWAPQFRIRYSRIWKPSEAEEIALDTPLLDDKPAIGEDIIINPPFAKPVFSIAIALPYYPGQHKFSFCQALYYNFIGENNSNTPFRNSGRLRFESWLFFYPKHPAKSRIGIAPYISLLTHGKDDSDRLLFGFVLQLKIEANLLKFF